jgi:hypothetical protein
MFRNATTLASIVVLGMVAAACNPVTATVQPLGLPVQFSIDSTGSVSVAAVAGIVTPLGEFTIEQNVYAVQPEKDESTLVVIRHKAAGMIFDAAYTVNSTDDLSAELDGHIRIEVSNRKVFIDASNGAVQSLTLNSTISARTAAPPSPPQATPNVPQGASSEVSFIDGLTSASHSNTQGSSQTFDPNGLNIVGDSGIYPVDSRSFADGDISVTARWVSGDPPAYYGLVFRSDYQFYLNGAGQWWVYWAGGNVVVPKTYNPAVKVGANRIRVVFKGDRFSFYMNDTLLGAVDEAQTPIGQDGLKTDSGTIGLIAYNGGYGGNNHVLFTDFVMRSGKLSGS